jgi:spore coat protein A, manganese oxidase
MGEFFSKVHRDLPPTRQWGYDGTSPGPTFETRTGQPISVEWVNNLPQKHFLPIDHNIMGAEKDKPEVRAIVHLHGAKAPPESDGYPEDWYVPGKSATTHYPNNQDAALLWYHDHTMGINRLNNYAGLLGFYIIRDPIEEALNLPAGKYEVPLALCDRSFRSDGQLNYPVSSFPNAPWVDECQGEFTLINGKLYPYLEVEPHKYRFRILNGSNSRFYNLSLSNTGEVHQIGSDQGLLSAPVTLKSSTIAPGERADVIIDFASHRGENITLRNGYLTLMQFRVSKQPAVDSSRLPATLRPVPRTPESAALKTRVLSLGEHHDMHGNATQMLLNGMHWHEPVTENPVLDTTEIWTMVNVTEDSHPIHLHLVRFQILDRCRFDVARYETNRELRLLGDAIPPGPQEAGWKDTVGAHGQMATRIIVRFEGYAGRYVWHCHNLEHEDNEMMRPFEVVPNSR